MTRRLILSIAAGAGAVLVTWVAPLFHIVPLEEARQSKEQTAFDAAAFAERFWDEQLIPGLSQAADASAVLEAIDRDFGAARTQYGRTVGISNSYYVFIQGTGRVVGANSKAVGVAVRAGATEADVTLPVGMVFGNAVRDATPLLDMDKFPNSQHFNDIATELNLLVEKRVLPQLRERAKAGDQIKFVACAQVPQDARNRKPLKAVPLRVEFVSRAPQPQ